MAKRKSKGLGDTIEKVTKATGIDKVVKFVLGEDCNCDKRKEKLNKMFPYIQPLCLEENEYNYLTEFLNSKTNQIRPSEQSKLLSIYNRVFKAKETTTTCSDCWRKIISELKSVYNEYGNN